MRLTKPPFFLLFILATAACQPEKTETEKPQAYWAEIYARFLASDLTYKTELTLLKGDSLATALPSRIDGTILIGDQALILRQLSGELIRYQLDYKGIFAPALAIDFQTNAFDRKQLSLSFKELPPFRVVDQQLSQLSGGKIILAETLRLSPDEHLLIMLNDARKQTASIQISGPASIDTILIRPDQLSALKNTGTGNIYLLSKKKGMVVDADASWGYVVEYYTDEQQLKISK